jgi:hypothetical protein
VSDETYEVIEAGHRYVLGETPESYGIWDRQAGNELVERFPLTEEGIDLALDRFAELKWKDRGERWNLPRVVRIATLSGALIWLIAGTGVTLIFSFGSTSIGIARILYALDAFGFRLAIGSLVVLAVLVLLRRLQPTEARGASLASFLRSEGPGRQPEVVLRGVLVVGLAVWIVSSIATEALFRFDRPLFAGTSNNAAIASQLVSTMAFRTWVASLILLVLTRLPARPHAAEAAQPDDG